MDKNRELKDQELEEANGGANVNIWDIAVKLKDKFNIASPKESNDDKK